MTAGQGSKEKAQKRGPAFPCLHGQPPAGLACPDRASPAGAVRCTPVPNPEVG